MPLNVLEEMIQEQPEKLIPVLTVLLCNTVSIPAEKAELHVHFIQTNKPSVQCGHLWTDRQGTVIPAGQVARVMCQILPHVDLFDSVFLLEPDDNNVQQAELSVDEGLLDVQNPRKLCVAVPVRNNAKHTTTLPRKTALGSIHSVEKVISPNQHDVPKPTLTVNSAVQPLPAPLHPHGNLALTSVT